jgi:predicted SAM-dependent methyltransferase
MQALKLNLGCGPIRPQGWINADSSLNAAMQRIPVVGKTLQRVFNTVKYDNNNVTYVNLNKRWKYADNSVDVVYSSHLLEHLSLKSAALFLRESYRCLKPGGVIRLVVPDLYKICKAYIADYESGKENPSGFIMWAMNLHREAQYGSNISVFKKIVYEWEGYPHQHKFMYDEKELSGKMKAAGFTDILSLQYGVSTYIQDIKDVEGKKEAYLSVYLEAKKPLS